MIYLLLILPHVVLIAGLLAFAYCSKGTAVAEGDDGRSYGYGTDDAPPRAPGPVPSGGGLPLTDASPPPRRLRVGERLADLHPRHRRRAHRPPLRRRRSIPS